MLILGLGAVAGLALGWAGGGRLRGLAELRFRAPLLLAVAVLIQAGTGLVAPGRRWLAIAVAYAVVGGWLLLNAAQHQGGIRAALVIVAFGWLLNAAPVVVNGGMPVSLEGLREVGAPATTSVSEGHFYKHVAAGPDTRLAMLGDVIPVPAVASVVSLGDLVMVVGVLLVITLAMRGLGPAEPVRSSVAVLVRTGR